MGRFEVAPPEVRDVGSKVEAFGPRIQSIGADASRLGAVTDPPRTAEALQKLAAKWSRGLSGLGEDVQILGNLTQIAATDYEAVDSNVIPDLLP